jgi:hypothetical protein
MFDAQGHLTITQRDFYDRARSDVRAAAFELLLTGTPAIFGTYSDYCGFVQELARLLGVHPRSVVIRGSGHLGFSVNPKLEKAWRPLRNGGIEGLSDIDAAVVDGEYFSEIDSRLRAWELKQGPPDPSNPDARRWVARGTTRQFNYYADFHLPGELFSQHFRKLARLRRSNYSGKKRKVSVFVFKDWWSLRSRCEYDLRQLLAAFPQGPVVTPVVSVPQGPAAGADSAEQA